MMASVNSDWVYTDVRLIPDDILFTNARIGLPEDYGVEGLVAVFVASNHRLNPEPICYVDAAERVDGDWVDVDGDMVECDERGKVRRVVAWTAFPALQFN